MRNIGVVTSLSLLCLSTFTLCSCSSMSSSGSESYASLSAPSMPQDFSSRLPQTIETQEKVVMVDPTVHTWGAYENGSLIKAGQASAGADYCPDLGRKCHTTVGSFRVYSLGEPTCKSRKFPIPKGGSPMPYCMYFAHGMALHGVPDSEVGEGNFSHGCVRLHVADAEWLRYNFVNMGTKVVVKPY
jgi:hypothetical protein